MSMLQEFKEFAVKGNVVDMAVSLLALLLARLFPPLLLMSLCRPLAYWSAAWTLPSLPSQ
jgi:hypothetical protein